MTMNLQVDDRLITKALKLGKHKTKKDAVTKALIEYINFSPWNFIQFPRQ